MLKLIPAALLLIGSVPAMAQAETAKSQKAEDSEKIVCQRYEETGSRLGSKKVCKTVREWEESRGGKRADSTGSTQSSSKNNAN